ncbi:uncharacterized protein LOC120684443 isoform X2 [Panicum virgatum]|nr:uncharacterized protein LOC120684443 isoform X2 [Panicum virgatum]
MDRDEICFFNLIELIEEYGYTSIDYLYYKKKDNLVALQGDTDVMKMLEENESKKNVSLFVTRQRIATIAPTKSNKEPSKSAANKAKEKSGRKKKQQLNIIQSKEQYANEADHQLDDDDVQETPGDDNKVTKRKGTVLAHVWDLPEENRILVKCNQLGQPIGKEGGLLGQFLGTISRNGGYCPLHIKDWRKVKNDNAETIFQCIQTKFLYPRSCEKWILKSIGRDWRKYKATLKSKLYNQKKKRTALYKLCPDDIDEDQWKALVKYWKSAEGKALSERNKLSREMKKTTHTAGTKSYARWSEDLRQADPAKRKPHRAMVYLAIHRKMAKETNQPTVQLENLIEKQPELAQNSEGRVAWEGDALHQVLGEEKPGQVHGMGLLPIPKQVYGGTTRHFKDINIATLHGSSSDVETHMLEEIKQLKERSRRQDKVIDELINKNMHHEREESTKDDHNKFQNQVVSSNRKRVQCAEPHNVDIVSQQRDELCQGDANHIEFSDQEAHPSSPQCSTNDFRQKEVGVRTHPSSDGRINRKRKQGALQDKPTGQKCSKYTRPQRIKVNKHNVHSDWIIFIFTQLMIIDDYVNSI